MTVPAEGTPVSAVTGVEVPVTEVRRDHLFLRLLRDPLAIASMTVLAIVVLAAVFAPLLTSYDPNKSALRDTLAAAGSDHLLGGDGVGRDVWARLVYGARTSLIGALIAVVVAVIVGVPVGVMAGYFKGWFDAAATWVANLLQSLPAIIVLLVAIAAIGPNIYAAMAVFGVLISSGVFRLIRGSVTAVREELYVDAARVSGLSDPRIMRRHIFPVVSAPTIIQAAQLIGLGIVIQAGLEFLGLGSTTQPSWGAMLNDGFANIYVKPILLFWPALAIGLTAASCALLGSAIRDAMVGGGQRKKRRRVKGGAVNTASVHTATTVDSVPKAAAPVEDALLTVRNLKVSYPRGTGESVVVRGISLAVRKGEVLGLVGESGSGKSQTAFSILGLLPPDAQISAGQMTFDGVELAGLSRKDMNQLRGMKIGYIPQEPLSNLDPAFRVGYQLTQPIRQHLGISKSEAKAKALSLLERVGIVDPERVFRAYPHEISGGMAQRILIAGAVSCDPVLLIADEPTTALDVTVQAEVLDLMRSLQAERHMAMILVTHDFGVVADICDTVAVMQTGQIVEVAPCGELFGNPQHDYTRMLLASTLENTAARASLDSTSDAGTQKAATT